MQACVLREIVPVHMNFLGYAGSVNVYMNAFVRGCSDRGFARKYERRICVCRD